ncbi:hypothetical protein CBR_g23868 [Chara braunii]|uniref:Reverse transcriptase domain-containing protein n=1 Tax=Chara braunii TaxID=69332 RepID=A0A388L519_CHABU|nr:hypothetical protein CBR_g23868 [Chara braunii]|eukprot:GBG77419.1 hypothetical protein CBR_g23868 [Chara braunii]
MPYGLCNAPTTFQRATNVTFQNFVNKTRLTQGMINFCVIVYVNDILVYSESFHGHAQHIEWTLGALRDAGFKIALEKSEFFLSEISFLGYVVTRGGLRPDSRKVKAVREAPTPTSLTQVRAFLELASYYRRFIKGFAAIARPLMNLLRKDQPLSWDAEFSPLLSEDVELPLIQAWKTDTAGDFLGFVFGSVEQGHRRTIVSELLILQTELLDDLPLDVISHSDKSPVPHILSRSLVPYLQWSACLEGDDDNACYPSHSYLDPLTIADALFNPVSGGEEEEEEEEEEDEEETSEEDEDYSEHSEHEAGVVSEEEEEEEREEAEEEAAGEEVADEAEAQEEDLEAERRRATIAEGK